MEETVQRICKQTLVEIYNSKFCLVAEQNGEGLSRPTTALVLSNLIANNSYFDASADLHLLTVSQVLTAGPTNWNETLASDSFAFPVLDHETVR